MPELSNHELIKVFKLASLGKLIGGLIHNVNGPLQNLGLDMEMTEHFLRNDPVLDEDLLSNLRSRIKRMGVELNRLETMVKTTSLRADPNNEFDPFLSLNCFIDQELQYFQSNLYFKHNVRTSCDLQDKPPSAGNLPNDFFPAFDWFLQSIIEELENRGVKRLCLETSVTDLTLTITITTKEGELSEAFLGQLDKEVSQSIFREKDTKNMGIMLALIIFGESGISVTGRSEAESSTITCTIPIRK